MTADIPSNDSAQPEVASEGPATDRMYLLVAGVMFVVGLGLASLAALQLVVPSLLSTAWSTYGLLAPAARSLLADGWLPIAGLGLTLFILSQITGGRFERRGPATTAMVLIAAGAIASSGDIIAGLSTGVPGLEGPIWGRAMSAIGYVLGAYLVTSLAKGKRDHLGTAGWYLTAASWWLALSSVFGLIPLMSGTRGSIQAAFADAGLHRLFAVTLAIGLLYYAFGKISGADLTEPRPLAGLGFWSVGLTWAFMGSARLIYAATPDWYETMTIAFAIAALVPVLAIATDIGLLLKGNVQTIEDRATFRYGTVAGLALVGATIVNLLGVWRATSAVVQYSTWSMGLDTLIVLGAGSFAIFAANSVRLGGNSARSSIHFLVSTIGLTGLAAGLLAGGIVSGFSWIAGPSSQLFPNFGPGYEIAVASLAPFLWIAAGSMALYAIAQILYLSQINAVSAESLTVPDGPMEYDLEFEGAMRYVTWRRLTWGATMIWIAAAFFTALLPMMDSTDTAATITADEFRTYASGSSEATGRSLYIAEGCAECHTQSVRPIVTDVGLGPVSIAGDYAYENPALITGVRFGPDLTHVASRTESFDAIATHLLDPRSVVEWSIMPSYAHLSDEDIAAIISYIETLR
ncbi:MAG: cbb3-type cytochrome c oxidase subunit II [Actinomycetota bacterium]